MVELALGGALVALRGSGSPSAGVVAAFFVAIFPGNISQLVTRTDAFGLDSRPGARVRLLFQPLLVLWALWSTGAWRAWRREPGPPRADRPRDPPASIRSSRNMPLIGLVYPVK